MNLQDSQGDGRFLCKECLQTNDSLLWRLKYVGNNVQFEQPKPRQKFREIPPALYVNLSVFPMSNIFTKPSTLSDLRGLKQCSPETNQLRHGHTLHFLNLAPRAVNKLPVFVQQLPRAWKNSVKQCEGVVLEKGPSTSNVQYFTRSRSLEAEEN